MLSAFNEAASGVVLEDVDAQVVAQVGEAFQVVAGRALVALVRHGVPIRVRTGLAGSSEEVSPDEVPPEELSPVVQGAIVCAGACPKSQDQGEGSIRG